MFGRCFFPRIGNEEMGIFCPFRLSGLCIMKVGEALRAVLIFDLVRDGCEEVEESAMPT